MKTNLRRLLLWTPRVLGLLFAAFISIFALDVFDEHLGFWPTALALVMHLIPTAILLVLVALAWRWPWIGAVAFPALGGFYIASFWGRFPWPTYLIIAGLLFLVGALFLLSWMRRAELRPAA
jgi:MFS family permease